MKTLFKKTTCFMLAALLCASALLVHTRPESVSAATKYDTIYQSSGKETASANVTKSTSFTVTNGGAIYIDVFTGYETSFTLGVSDASGSTIDSENVTPSSKGWSEASGVSYYESVWNLSAGTYSLDLTFPETSEYLIQIDQDAVVPTLSNSCITLTAGFTKKLTVSNAGKNKITWASTNKKVATVNSKGVVTAKKKGSCKITAKVNGKTLKCTVKVYNNVYSQKKATNSDFYSGCTPFVYQASFDSKGNLKMKVRVINNSGHTVTKLSSIKFYVKAANKATVATYNLGTKKMTIYNGSYKDFAVTIPKSKIKKTKNPIDLRLLYGVEIKGSYQYNYNY